MLCKWFLVGMLLGQAGKEVTESYCSHLLLSILQGITLNTYKMYELKKIHGELPQFFPVVRYFSLLVFVGGLFLSLFCFFF